MERFLGEFLKKAIFRHESDKAITKNEKNLVHPALPHGQINQIFENVWFVTGQVKMPMLFPPMKISRSMTIIRNPESNELTLVNTMRLSEQGLKELEKFGTIKNTLRIAGFHGRDDAFYRERYNATVFALEGHVYTREMMRPYPEHSMGYMQPDVWLKPGDFPPVPRASLKWFPSCSKPEAILVLDQAGGILVTGDSLQNTARADEFNNWISKIMMKKMDFLKAYNVGPGWVQFAHPTIEDIRSILELGFEHVLPGHGDPVIGSAKEKYRPTIMGNIKGCHASET